MQPPPPAVIVSMLQDRSRTAAQVRKDIERWREAQNWFSLVLVSVIIYIWIMAFFDYFAQPLASAIWSAAKYNFPDVPEWNPVNSAEQRALDSTAALIAAIWMVITIRLFWDTLCYFRYEELDGEQLFWTFGVVLLLVAPWWLCLPFSGWVKWLLLVPGIAAITPDLMDSLPVWCVVVAGAYICVSLQWFGVLSDWLEFSIFALVYAGLKHPVLPWPWSEL